MVLMYIGVGDQAVSYPIKQMLSEICAIESNRIHSKKALLNYLLKNTDEDLITLKDNIIKLSYSNKLMAIQGETTQRLPLRGKLHSNPKPFSAPNTTDDQDYLFTGRFITKSLRTGRKKEKVPQQQFINPEFPQHQPPTKGTYPRVKSIKSFYSLKLIRDKLKNSQDQLKPVSSQLILPRRNTKSYSQMLSEVGAGGVSKLQPMGRNRMMDKISKIAHLTKIKLSQGEHFEKIAYLQNLEGLE